MTYEPVSLESLLAHQSWALRIARRLVHEDGEAEDLVQRTWLAALRRPPDSERGARAWIRQVILNLARERHRRKQARDRAERDAQRLDLDPSDASEFASGEEIRELLAQRLLDLGEPYREVLVERYYEGRTSAEIARRMGIPAGTVRWRLKVGLDQLRVELDRRSHGDRSRWVSALVLLLPLDSVPPDPEELAAPAAPTAGFLATASWLAVASLSVLGIVLLTGSSSRGRSHDEAGVADTASTLEALPGRAAARESTAARTATPPALARSTPAEPALPRIRVRVEGLDGAPVAGAELRVARGEGLDPRARTDEHGWAWLEVRPDDLGALGVASTRERLSLQAVAEGRTASPLLHVGPPFDEAHEVCLVVGEGGCSLEGRVLDPDGAPVADAVVAWFDPRGHLVGKPEGDFESPSYVTARSDAAGRFRLSNLAPRGGHIGCFAPGQVIYTQMIDFDGQHDPLVVRLDPGAVVSGRVLGPGGRPVGGVEVTFEPVMRAAEWAAGLPSYDVALRGFPERARTDENGRFRIPGVSTAHTRTLWARDPVTGLAASTTLELRPNEEAEWNALLEPRAGYRFRLLDENDEPLAGWFVHARRSLNGENWWIRRSATDAEGRLEIPDALPGFAFIDVFNPTDVGASFAWGHYEARDEEQVIRVATLATSSVSGRLLDPSGRPDLRGDLMLHSLFTTLITPVLRDEEGAFDTRAVPGTYALVLELEQTAVQLCALKVAPGEEHALGLIKSPPEGLLRLDGAQLFNGDSRQPSYSVFLLGNHGRSRGNRMVAKGWFGGDRMETEAEISSFPGDYRILAFDGAGSPPRVYEVTVASFEETRLRFDPDSGQRAGQRER